MNSVCSDNSSEQQGRLMQGRDGEPPEAVRACGRDGGGVDGELGRRSCYCVGRRSLQRRERRWKKKRERVTVAIIFYHFLFGRGCREERETDGGSWWSVGGCVGFLWCS